MPSNTTADRSGQLVVFVRTGGNALPVEGATVLVQGADAASDGFTRTLVTDESGRTEALSLDTPSKAGSLTPGVTQPYGIYNIRVTKDGFYVHENRNVPVFPGVTSIQPAELIPLAPYNGANSVPLGNITFIAGQNLNELAKESEVD